MKYYLFIVIAIMLFGCCNNKPDIPPVSSPTIDTSFVRNDRIKYGIGRAFCDTFVPPGSMDFRVGIILDSVIEKMDALSDEFLLRKLSDTTSDWAANLILYCKYDKDAIPLLHYDRELWARRQKQEDFAYWKQRLGRRR